MSKRKWVKRRHTFARNLLSLFLGPYSRLKYGVRVERFKEQEKRPYLILYNHQTPFDQFFVGMAFRGPVYYMATEDIFSLGLASSIIKYLVAPIPIQKCTTDVRAVMNCIRVVREGGTVAIAPEGNRTYSGKTGYMNPAIAALARKLGAPIVLYRLDGGYGIQPRWSDVVRKGKGVRAYVHRVIKPEEYAEMTDAELYEAIKDGLHTDESLPGPVYKHSRRAEYLERAIYACPECGLSVLESCKDVITCKKCGRAVRFNEDKSLSGVGFELPFSTVSEWYDYQSGIVNSLNPATLTDSPLWNDTVATYEVIPFKTKKTLAKSRKISLYGDRITLDDGERIEWAFDEIEAIAVLGRNKLNVYHGGRVFQLKGDKRFNALKYMHIYHRFKNVKEGRTDVEFLGL